mgnify:CR=1 FL=1
MGNVFNNDRRNLRLLVNEDEYWDFHIDNDCVTPYEIGVNGDGLYDKCLVAYVDFTDDECLPTEIDAVSKGAYRYEDAVSNGFTMQNIGYTGVDNGFITYRKDKITNEQFKEIYEGSAYSVEKDDFRLKLRRVGGNTMRYSYPIEFTEEGVKLDGGFYQGFFKHGCDAYSILPSKLDDSWHFEFTLRREGREVKKGTVNDRHPLNKGMFFFIGLRAENKWYTFYEDDKDECYTIDLSDYVEGGEIRKEGYIVSNFQGEMIEFGENVDAFDDFVDDNQMTESDGDYIAEDTYDEDYEYKVSDGRDLTNNNQVVIETDNKFITFDRTCDGFNVENYEEGTIVRYIGEKRANDNKFITFNRTCSGETAISTQSVSEKNEPYDIYGDIYDNCFGLRITDDGAIGYKMITRDCESDNDGKLSFLEGYSNDGVIPMDEFVTVNVRLRRSFNKMVGYFYVNGKLKYVTDELPLLNLRGLKEADEKTEGVAFNISVGGGTQGLMEPIYPNYMLNVDKVLPLEEWFGGSFIGTIKSFRFYDCHMEPLAMLKNVGF